VKRIFNLCNRVAFRGGHYRGVIFALAGRNTAFGFGFGAYSVGVHWFSSYPFYAITIKMLGRRDTLKAGLGPDGHDIVNVV
jgi:hypothetical protein